MKLRTWLLNGLLALAAFFGTSGLANAQNWQQVCYGTDLYRYSQVKVTFTCNNPRSWYKSAVFVNGAQIAVVGNGYFGQYGECSTSDAVFGRTSSLGFSASHRAGNFGSHAWSPSFSSDCRPVFEDSYTNEPEGFINIFVADPVAPTLYVSKSANSLYLSPNVSDQYYTITVSVSDGPTTQPITVTDNLPAGVTVAGTITASGGSLSNCPGAGATSLSCIVAAGTSGVSIRVPINVSDAVANHNNFSFSNTAFAQGGGSSNCTSNACSGSTTNRAIIALDDTDTKPAGVPSSTNVSPNDSYPTNATFTTTGGTCTGISPASPTTNFTGLLSYTLPAGSQSCTVNYRLCAPSPYTTVCDSATLTVNGSGPVVTVNKTLGGNGRVAAADQFTVQLLQGSTVVNDTTNSTTSGGGTTVNPGSGTTGAFAATPGTTYSINEAGSNGAVLGRYSSSVDCSVNGTPLPAFNLGGSITPTASDTWLCSISNSPKPATLTVRQMVLSPVPPNILPPYSQTHTGSNGWGQQTLTNTVLNRSVASPSLPLAALNTATQVSTTLPDARWFVASYSCRDTAAAISGNPTTVFVTSTVPSITIAADNVRAGAVLVCTILLGRLTP